MIYHLIIYSINEASLIRWKICLHVKDMLYVINCRQKSIIKIAHNIFMENIQHLPCSVNI